MAADSFRALYLHVPFCVQRCAYCDFHTRAVPCDDSALDAYAESLSSDLAGAAERDDLDSIETVYIGGGTPSFLGASRLERLLCVLETSLDTRSLSEFTVEANPDSLSSEVLEVLAGHGVNRLSIGVQSLDDDVLAVLGRVHDAKAALEAIEMARAAVGNVSADVICGVPGQSAETLRRTVGQLVDAGVAHVSVYPLMIEEGTPLFRAVEDGSMPDVDEDVQADHMLLVRDALDAAGYTRYEVASHALPGFESLHNKMYWTGSSYLGLGDGASSMRNQPDGSRVRWTLAGGDVEDEVLDARQAACEDAMLAMRLVEGISRGRLAECIDRAPALREAVDEVVSLGLAEWTTSSLAPTERGWLMGNELYGRLWAAAELDE
ncbi:MAG: radical SAM family heme chaperone HemW [Coriobacteriales bacterium]